MILKKIQIIKCHSSHTSKGARTAPYINVSKIEICLSTDKTLSAKFITLYPVIP